MRKPDLTATPGGMRTDELFEAVRIAGTHSRVNWVGSLFVPFTWALQLPEPMLAAKASAVEIAEMFLPALLAANAPLVTKFVIGIVSVSSILFFSASIPCILSTEIPISVGELIIIWVERTLLSLLIATPLVYLLL
ncbi:hypothetical protein C8P63_109107 [Melghirimyces profundicolus]|uniref:Nucleoside recognition protein n=1 Tax=Melghirimyces profundicolus TaxID=1242148 RepID=A0A2T6BW86_9BACL|nr:hypothetical protein C8P63_109107 [Melghirimyces profundicolus]